MKGIPNIVRRPGRRWLAVLLVTTILAGATASAAAANRGGTSLSPVFSSCPSPASGINVGDTVCLTGLVKTPKRLTVADLQALGNPAHITTTFKAGSGSQTHTFDGVRLVDVINQAGGGLIVNPDRKNDKLRKYIVFTAKDDYEAIVSWGEIDPSFENKDVLIAWNQDGQPLTGDNGPVRLVVPGDGAGGRYVNGVVTMEVRDVDSPPRPNHALDWLFRLFS